MKFIYYEINESADNLLISHNSKLYQLPTWLPDKSRLSQQINGQVNFVTPKGKPIS